MLVLIDLAGILGWVYSYQSLAKVLLHFVAGFDADIFDGVGFGIGSFGQVLEHNISSVVGFILADWPIGSLPRGQTSSKASVAVRACRE